MSTTTAINNANCNITGNTGAPVCDVEVGVIRYLIFIPKGFVIPAASTVSVATFATYIKAAMQQGARSGTTPRFFITPELVEFTDATEKTVMEKRDNFSKPVSFPPYMWGWLMETKLCLFKKWRAFQNQQNQYDVLTVDENGVITGTIDPAGTTGMAGVSLYALYFPDFAQKTVQKAAAYSINIGLVDNRQIIENRVSIAAGLTTPPPGLVDVDFGTLVTTTASHLKVTGTFGCNGSDLGYYSASLAAVGAWVFTDNGSPATPTAAAWVPAVGTTQGYYDFTFSAPFTTAHVVTSALAAPSVLLAISSTLNIISETPISATLA